MTWVIGASSVFGYGVMMSDVRVTFGDGSERDLVKKAYPVGRFIVAGFAGSIRIGFQMIESLKEFLVPPSNAGPGAWRPEWIAEHWKPIAGQIFATAHPQEQAARCQILLVGVSNKVDPESTARLAVGSTPGASSVRY
jgi:hypothetical protein